MNIKIVTHLNIYKAKNNNKQIFSFDRHIVECPINQILPFKLEIIDFAVLSLYRAEIFFYILMWFQFSLDGHNVEV